MNEENGLPEGWVWTTIGEVAETTSGGTPPRSHPEYYGGAIPWVKSGELEDTIINDVEEFITEEGLKNSSAKVFHQGTVLVAMYGATVGRTGILGLDATTNQAVCAIFPLKNAFTSKFIAYWLQSQRQTLIDQSFGGAQPNINQGIIRAFPLPLAPLPEQQRIVAAIEQQFSRLDAGVAALRRAQARLKRYRAAVLKAAVEGKLTEAWRAEHPATEPAYELLERILVERRAKWEADLRAKGKDPAKVKYVEPAKPDVENLLGLSEGWCWATAEQLSDESRAITYGVVKLGAPVAGGISTLRSSNVRHLRFDLEGLKSISPNIANEYRRTFLQGGEILVTVRGTLGGVAVVPTSFAGYNISREVAMIALVLPYIAPCLVLFIGSPPIQNWMMRSAKGIAYTGINIETLKEMPIPVPPRNEQEQIVSEVERRLSVVSQLEATVEANLKRAERLRQSILREAFAGRLVPQDPDDEPASVLLERIRRDREERKHGTVNKGRVVSGAVGEPVKIDVRETRQVELWESVGSGE